MDFSTLFRVNVSHATNGSGGNGLPENILEILSPILGFHLNPLMRLFMLLYDIVGSSIGIDLTYILTLVAVVWAANKLWHQLYSTVNSLARQHFMASIQIDNNDDIFLHMMVWLAQSNQFSRFLKAETVSKDHEDGSQFNIVSVSLDGAVDLDISRQEANVAPRFTPAIGEHGFWFNGWYFILQRRSPLDPASNTHGITQDKEWLVVSCYGRSTKPIERLLQHAKEQYDNSHQGRTTVRCPLNPILRRFHPNPWKPVCSRPVRPMKTVVLDKEQKARVIWDMHEFLLPETARYYARRGIPLRRGLLFYGPPGTGKTSLTFALAGVFGLDIYVIPHLEPTLTEEDLLGLFTSLPRRCIVLLEDIDTAGLKRDEDPAADSSSPRLASNHGTDSSKGKPQISLAGLLNAIDGVATQEGRVLIMTTNKPDKLDKALIRPGRVDLQVAFTNATEDLARELFVNMYEQDCIPREDNVPSQKSSMGSFNLKNLAEKFVSKVPPKEFSPAELQGFLLKHKDMPENAVMKVGEWVREKQGERKVGAQGGQ
ncbi:hypothetical protein N0V88_008140 [Collariella sp. IMI 366227]|nr:hypothetical protein N0V88_008140 [Collariella sp. IMI 366227]